jgi:DNA-binding LytR/AlgR family response regulator
MTPLKIGIIEDELLVARSIFVMLQRIGYSPIKPVRNYDDALAMIRTESPDLLLIDIMLDSSRDGIELAAEVNKEFGIPFIFLTANSDEATVNRAKEVKPAAYLIKPFHEKDLYSAVEIAFNNYNLQKKHNATSTLAKSKFTGSIFIKEGEVFQRVELADIVYLESDHVYLNLYTADKKYLIRSKLEDFLTDYSTGNFVRVHRSYAINVNHLETINELSVKAGGKEIPLSKNYRKELLEQINSLR